MTSYEEIEQRRELALKSVLAMRNNVESQAFVEFLESELKCQDEANRSLQGVNLFWGQGESQRLQKLLDMFADASGELMKIKTAQDRRNHKAKHSRRPVR